MAQAKLMPPANVLSLKVARAWQGEANGRAEAKANGHRPGAIEAGLPLTPQRLELIKAYANSALPGAQAPTASQIAQRFAPRAEAPPPSGQPQPAPQASLAAPLSTASLAAPFSSLASGIRRLTLVLVVAALLPNLTLAAFWLRLIDPPWSRPVTNPASQSAIPAAKPEIALPVLSAPARLEATAGEDALLPIALDGTDGVPAGSVIVVRGLPPGSALSNGRRHGETDWTLRPDEIGDLHLVPAGAGSSESMLTIQLVAPNNGILADAATVLNITAGPAAAIARAAIETAEAGTPQEELEVAALAEESASLDDAAALSEPVPLPTRRPAPSAPEGDRANWVKSSAYVNLREGPSSTARVVSVVAKGAKLRLIARKRGWVQVTDPETSHSGWIYGGNVETVP